MGSSKVALYIVLALTGLWVVTHWGETLRGLRRMGVMPTIEERLDRFH